MIDRLLDRLSIAVQELDVGVPGLLVQQDLLRAANITLGRIGVPRLKDLDNEVTLRRAMSAIEAEVEQ